MEAHRELVAPGRKCLALRGHERILAVEPLAVGRQHDDALVDDVEIIGVAVVRRAQHGAARLLLARDRDVARSADDRHAVQHAP